MNADEMVRAAWDLSKAIREAADNERDAERAAVLDAAANAINRAGCDIRNMD
jgi:hypothetical protein